MDASRAGPQLIGKSSFRAQEGLALAWIVGCSRNRVSTTLASYRRLVYNLLVANSDNHLKNPSVLLSAEGMEVAPAYDPLTTGSTFPTSVLIRKSPRAGEPRCPH